MKNVIIVVALALMSFASNAQQKIGHINSLELLDMMPEVKKANTELQALAKTYQDQLASMQKDLETKAKSLQAGEKTMTDAMKEVKYQELQTLQTNMQSTNDKGEEKIGQEKERLFKPILAKANKAIQDVAKEKNYSYVLDLGANGTVVFAADSDNLMAAVKAKLGIAASATPGK
jgi:outer membrane protein